MSHWLGTFRERLSLGRGTDVEGTVQRVSDGASLTTENLWLLVCSAILASIGLDTSSAAVVIGAMLISPLMGPILGVGLGMGVTDRALLQRSLRELALGTFLSFAASAVYFAVSPLATATPELIARTRPTLLDVGVAFFGGLAGIVAGSRRNISLALPGVAIATALMPPLCTAGFGFASGNWSFFFGALYLYALNAIFIALATFLVVRLLRFPHHEMATEVERRNEHRMVAFVAVLAMLPSTYFLYDAARRLRENGRIASFVQREIERPGRAVPQWEHRHGIGDEEVLKVYVAGHPLEGAQADSVKAALPRYGLEGLRLELVQSDVSAEDLTRLEGEVQRGILRAVTTATAARDTAIMQRAREDTLRLFSVAREIASAFPEIQSVAYTPWLNLLRPDSGAPRGAYLVTFGPRVRSATQQDVLNRARALVRTRLGSDSLTVLAR
jgi:uncharacterized hydrophobic protein (TIGR00271 family)